MRVLLQRVMSGAVQVDGQMVGKIDHGYVLLVGIGPCDDRACVERMAGKIVKLRLFDNDAGHFDRSVLDVNGDVLVVSQFTLFADTRKGRRPSFTGAASPDHASPLCDYFAECLKQLGVKHVATGEFGTHMHVDIQNDGPVTVWIDDA